MGFHLKASPNMQHAFYWTSGEAASRYSRSLGTLEVDDRN